MDEESLQQLFAELIESIEPLEAKHAALLQLLKSKGVVTDEELAPFLGQAGNASDIRWRAVKLRTHALVSSALGHSSQPAEPKTSAAAAQNQRKTGEEKSDPAKDDRGSREEPGEKSSEGQDKRRQADPPGEARKAQSAEEQTRARKADAHPSRDQKQDDKTNEELRDSKLSNPPLIQSSKDDATKGKNEKGDNSGDAASRPDRSKRNKPPQSDAA